MDEQRIWAPWRLGYIVGDEDLGDSPPEPSAWQPGAEHQCFLCRAAACYEPIEESQRRNLVVEESLRRNLVVEESLRRNLVVEESLRRNLVVEESLRRNLVVDIGAHTIALLNRYPYSNGHLLISPLRHVGQLHELTPAEHLEAMQTLGRFTQLLEQLISAAGFNVGLNLGQVAGAGVPGHLHWHLVPRWPGDHNFMPTLAGVRIIPQSLEALWEAITSVKRR